MEHEKLQQNCPAPQWRWLHGSPASALAGGPARAAAVSNRAKRIAGRFLFTAVLLSVPVGVVPPYSLGAGRRSLRDSVGGARSVPPGSDSYWIAPAWPSNRRRRLIW